jgi:hypothetical protein
VASVRGFHLCVDSCFGVQGSSNVLRGVFQVTVGEKRLSF